MDETALLRQELEHYKKEKERVRRIIGQIGGQKSGRRDTVISVVFLTIVTGLFLFDVAREIFAIEIAVLLVSLGGPLPVLDAQLNRVPDQRRVEEDRRPGDPDRSAGRRLIPPFSGATFGDGYGDHTSELSDARAD